MTQEERDQKWSELKEMAQDSQISKFQARYGLKTMKAEDAEIEAAEAEAKAETERHLEAIREARAEAREAVRDAERVAEIEALTQPQVLRPAASYAEGSPNGDERAAFQPRHGIDPERQHHRVRGPMVVIGLKRWGK